MPPTAVASWGGKWLADPKNSYEKYHWESGNDIGLWSYCPLAFLQLIGMLRMDPNGAKSRPGETE